MQQYPGPAGSRAGWLVQGQPPYGYDRLYLDAAGREVLRVVGSNTARKQKGWTCVLVAIAGPGSRGHGPNDLP